MCKSKELPSGLRVQLALAGCKASELAQLYRAIGWQQYLARHYLTHQTLMVAAELVENSIAIAYRGSPSSEHPWLNEDHCDYVI